jgi:hypothetical protein
MQNCASAVLALAPAPLRCNCAGSKNRRTSDTEVAPVLRRRSYASDWRRTCEELYPRRCAGTSLGPEIGIPARAPPSQVRPLRRRNMPRSGAGSLNRRNCAASLEASEFRRCSIVAIAAPKASNSDRASAGAGPAHRRANALLRVGALYAKRTCPDTTVAPVLRQQSWRRT